MSLLVHPYVLLGFWALGIVAQVLAAKLVGLSRLWAVWRIELAIMVAYCVLVPVLFYMIEPDNAQKRGGMFFIAMMSWLGMSLIVLSIGAWVARFFVRRATPARVRDQTQNPAAPSAL